MRELEVVTAAVAADGLARAAKRKARKAAADPGVKHAALHTECLNCGATLHGRYCQDCGQSDDDHHRSIFHLIWEAIEGLTHLDGRLMRTLPPLFVRPGRLARDHLEGRRQRHVPPFRLFLITLLIFMFSLELATHHSTPSPPEAPAATPPAAQTTAQPPASAAPPSAVGAPKPAGGEATINIGNTRLKVDREAPTHGLVQVNGDVNQGFDQMAKSDKPIVRWAARQGRKAMASQEYFRSILFEWGHRLAILLLPIFAGLLTLSYFYKRQFYVYDHLVVAMHFLSFTFLIWAVVYLIPEPLNGFAFLAATVWTPVNLFMTLRGAYGSSIVGAGVKTLALWTATLLLFLGLLVGVILVALGSV